VEITHLIVDFDVLIQLISFIRRQIKIILFGHVDDRLRADRAFEMDVDFGLGNSVVFWVEVFHGSLPALPLVHRIATLISEVIKLLITTVVVCHT
jgi:hypothetical protein